MKCDCVIIDKKGSRVLAANREGEICLEIAEKYTCNIDVNDIDHVVMFEPKLLKKGGIMFYGTDGEVMVYDTDNSYLHLSALIEVPYKERDSFYLMYDLLKKLGIEIKVF